MYAGNKTIASHERCFERGQIVIGDGHFDDRPYEERPGRWVLLHQDIWKALHAVGKGTLENKHFKYSN